MKEKLKYLTSRKSFHVCMIIIIIAIILFIVGILVLRYQVEGETNMPFDITKVILISSSEGIDKSDNAEGTWAFDINQNNDIYIYIEKNSNYKEEAVIQSVVINQIKVEKQNEKGTTHFYRPNVEETGGTFNNTEENEIQSIEYEGSLESDIKNLKIGYNKIFGYYIEVSKSFVKMAPERYIRKQTLTTGERYITEELKNLENQIIGSQERVVALEYDAFVKVRNTIEQSAKRLQTSASIVAKTDVLCSLAKVAEEMNYCMPEVDNSDVIDIKDGRHPVIEKMLPAGAFVQNDAYLDSGENRLDIITGPNMAGKSTYMRQVALITLMAQIGSFVPAREAHIGIVDKIFTRVGASDDLSMGESTFMVEMMEVASILKNATNKSLVILDEIGRGTSTYDGLSIAWAVAEYIANKEVCGAKTLFATHYHELVGLENKLEGVKNFHVAVKEKGEDVIFLRKILPGGTDESYGVHVAKLAGVPKSVTKRANEILKTLERKSIIKDAPKTKEEKAKSEGQMDMFNYKLAEIAHELDQVKLEEVTPIDALNILSKMKEKMQ